MRKLRVPLLLCLVALAACKRKNPVEAAARSRAAENDRKCAELLGQPNVSEARAWTHPDQTRHMGFELGKDQMRAITEELYREGASMVWVADIGTLGENEIAAILIAELPTDPGRRLGVLDQAAKYEEFPEERPRDVGQRYVFVALD